MIYRLCRSSAVSLVSAAMVAVAVSGSTAVAQSIGVASDVDSNSHRAAAGATVRSEIGEDDDVFVGDRITTDGTGRLRLALDDDSVLVVGPDSRLTLDEFVYGGAGDSLTTRLTVGGFRFISGAMPSSSYRFQTPVAEVGLRGTDIVVFYDQIRRLVWMVVLAGEAWIRPLGVESQTVVVAGQRVEVLSANAPPSVGPAGPTPRWSRVVVEAIERIYEDGPDGSGGDPGDPSGGSGSSGTTNGGTNDID